MRLIGYPAEKISILTTYNGQKHLLRDVANRRCADNPLIGLPHKITTVDKYQGQQNDYVLISLVRTKTVGHLRDVRRLVVAASRARLGLYIFGRVALFKNCFELKPTFDLLMKRPQKLMLVEKETFDVQRKLNDSIKGKILTFNDATEMAQYVYKMYMTKIEGMRGEYEKMKELYEKQMAKEEEQTNQSLTKSKTNNNSNKEKKENAPFVPIPINNEIDDDVLNYAGELQGPSLKKLKLVDDENNDEEQQVEDNEESNQAEKEEDETIATVADNQEKEKAE
jgi:intron-binding protein aquarius